MIRYDDYERLQVNRALLLAVELGFITATEMANHINRLTRAQAIAKWDWMEGALSALEHVTT